MSPVPTLARGLQNSQDVFAPQSLAAGCGLVGEFGLVSKSLIIMHAIMDAYIIQLS